MFGDLPADRGTVGGGIRASERGSGDTESGPDPRLLPPDSLLRALDSRLEAAALSSGTTSGSLPVVKLCLRRPCGLTSGDCRTLRAGVRVEVLGLRLLFLVVAPEPVGLLFKSTPGSIGEPVAPVSEPGALVYVGWWCGCASSAGELSGEKYSPG